MAETNININALRLGGIVKMKKQRGGYRKLNLLFKKNRFI